MKKAQLQFVGGVINQLKTVPQDQLTQEYIATLFADRLEHRYKANFNRTLFLEEAGVSPRMVEEVETQIPQEPARTESGHLRPFAPRFVAGCR